MDSAKQEKRVAIIATPLGKDFLLIEKLVATEGISQLFSFELDLLKDEMSEGTVPTPVDPKSILGKQVSIQVELDDKKKRYFSGIVSRFSAGQRHGRFSFYKAEIVPHLWLLTKRIRSQIFQQKSVKDILEKLFEGLDVKWDLTGTYHKRNYCVQYRESDFNFASRLMEEEGIFYFFKHTDGSHQLVVADAPGAHPEISPSTLPFYMEVKGEAFQGSIHSFDVEHVLDSGAVTFWDHNFETHDKKLNAEKTTVNVVGDNTKLEVYDYPGLYAQRFDGIDKGGGEQPGELNKIFEDNVKRASTAMQVIDAGYEVTKGVGTACPMVAGHKFTLEKHPNAKLNQSHVIVSMEHSVQQSPSYLSRNDPPHPYTNSFTCIPASVPFRPAQKTPKPVVHGSQTAFVVAVAGEEITTDKYGRVKVQFHWDRDGKYNPESSCWVRVAQMWAGNQWGTMFIPRKGMEVVCDFLEGDPDRPIIVGCVYNPKTMPPYKLPDHKTRSTIKSDSTKGGGGSNEFRFEDKKGSEQIFIHAEKNEDIRVKNDCFETIGNNRHLVVGSNQYESVKGNQHLKVSFDRREKVGMNLSTKVGMNHDEKVGMKYALDSGMEIHLKSGLSTVIEAGLMLTLKAGASFITISPAGIAINGMPMTLINSGGAAGSGSGQNTQDPDDAKVADTAEAGKPIPTPNAPPPPKPNKLSPLAASVVGAAGAGSPFVGK